MRSSIGFTGLPLANDNSKLPYFAVVGWVAQTVDQLDWLVEQGVVVALECERGVAVRRPNADAPALVDVRKSELSLADPMKNPRLVCGELERVLTQYVSTLLRNPSILRAHSLEDLSALILELFGSFLEELGPSGLSNGSGHFLRLLGHSVFDLSGGEMGRVVRSA
jgi:hypothetical protein